MDILCGCKTQIHKVKKMIDTPLIILAAIWVSLTGYAIWYATSAKRNLQSRLMTRKRCGRFTRKTPNALVTSGVPFRAEAAKFLASNASVDTSTIKSGQYYPACPEIATEAIEIKVIFRLQPTKLACSFWVCGLCAC